MPCQKKKKKLTKKVRKFSLLFVIESETVTKGKIVLPTVAVVRANGKVRLLHPIGLTATRRLNLKAVVYFSS